MGIIVVVVVVGDGGGVQDNIVAHMELDTMSIAVGMAVGMAAAALYKVLSAPKPPAGKLEFVYFPIAGRGELCRLIAAVGGLELTESKGIPDGGTKEAYGSPSGVPLLKHGDLKLSQSAAIEVYLASLVPKFAALSTAQKATDHMFLSIKEDVLIGCAKVVFGGNFLAEAPTAIPKHCDKWFPVVEGLLPSDGFILGLDFPTVADLSVLNMARAYMPFGAAYKHGKYEYASKYPKMKALVERTAGAPGVKEYLAKTKSMDMSFLDVDK